MSAIKPFVSVVMPCLNEEKTVGLCIKRAKLGIQKFRANGEIIVCDNGSTDNSVKFAREAGARVVIEKRKGYGNAYLTGIKTAKGNWIVMGDSDGTYNFLEIPKIISPLSKGFDLVIGSRLKGKIKEGSMPFLNRYLGTPCLNLFIKTFFNIHISDSQSGMRAFTKNAYSKLKLCTLGMEFASEMIIRASQEKLKITETPISYSPRIVPTKLARFKDAWRHIRFMLLFAPTYLFLIPGVIFMSFGLAGVAALARGPLGLFNKNFDFHSMILASMSVLLGYQIIMLGIYAKTYSWKGGFNKEGAIIRTTLRYFKLEKGILLGLTISGIGFIIGLLTLLSWAQQGFGELWAIRPAILSMTFIMLGIQILFSSFFLSILGIEQASQKDNL